MSTGHRLWRIAFPAILLGLVLVLASNKPELNAILLERSGFRTEAFIDALLAVGFWITLALFLIRLANIYILDGLVTVSLGRTVPKIVKDMSALMIVIFAIGGLLASLFGGSMSGLWAFSGVIGVVIGLAIRPIILDIFSGLSANMENCFQMGDWVSMQSGNGTYEGWVTQIGWRTTQILSRSGNLIIVPNSIVATTTITNLSRPKKLSRFEVFVKVAPEVDCERAKRIIGSAAVASMHDKNGPSKEKTPEVLITEISSDGIEYWVRFWLDPAKDSKDKVIDCVCRSIMRNLDQSRVRLATSREELSIGRRVEISSDLRDSETRRAIVARVDLFRSLPEDAITEIEGAMEIRAFSKGDVLVNAGDHQYSMFILTEGLLEVIAEPETEGEERVHLAHIRPGDFFGEMSLLTGQPRSATVEARTDSVCLEIKKDRIQPILGRYPQVMAKLSAALAERQMNNSTNLYSLGLHEGEDGSASFSAQIFERMKVFFKGGMSRNPMSNAPEPAKTAGERHA